MRITRFVEAASAEELTRHVQAAEMDGWNFNGFQAVLGSSRDPARDGAAGPPTRWLIATLHRNVETAEEAESARREADDCSRLRHTLSAGIGAPRDHDL